VAIELKEVPLVLRKD